MLVSSKSLPVFTNTYSPECDLNDEPRWLIHQISSNSELNAEYNALSSEVKEKYREISVANRAARNEAKHVTRRGLTVDVHHTQETLIGVVCRIICKQGRYSFCLLRLTDSNSALDIVLELLAVDALMNVTRTLGATFRPRSLGILPRI